MNIEQNILEKLHQLPLEKQREVLDFTEFLYQKNVQKVKLKPIKGLCSDLKIDISEEEINEARQEMWGNFPREIV
jgi:hypothetical protein